MHLRRVRRGRKALALLAEYLALEPRQLMLQRVNLLTLCRDGSRLREDQTAQVHTTLMSHLGGL
jgi:hypothetical protein